MYIGQKANKFIKYIYSALSKNDEVKEEMEDLSIKDNDYKSYMTLMLREYSSAISLDSNEILNDSKDAQKNRKISSKVLKNIGKIMQKSGYSDYIVHDNNQKFRSHESSYIDFRNPWFLNKENFSGEFKVKNDTSNIEIYAKNMLWTNRLAKFALDIKSDICDENQSKSMRKIYKELLHSETEVDGEHVSESFLNTYSEFMYGDIEKEELESSVSYNEIKNIVKKFGNDIDMQQVFNYIACETSINELYSAKVFYQDLVVNEYSRLSQEDNLNGVEVFAEDDRKGLGPYTKVLNVNLPGYNNVISTHITEDYLKEITEKSDIELKKCKTDLPLVSSLSLYKYSDKQVKDFNSLKKIGMISNDIVRENLEFAIYKITGENNKFIKEEGVAYAR